MKIIFYLLLISTQLFGQVYAQRKDAISDESKVAAYQLPEVLTRFNGGKARSEKAWFKKQRPDILKVFTD